MRRVRRVAIVITVCFCAGCGSQSDAVLFRGAGAPGSAGVHRYEYIFLDRELDVVEAQPPFRLVERVRIREFHSLRGVAVDPRSATVYASVGGNGGSSGHGGPRAPDPVDPPRAWGPPLVDRGRSPPAPPTRPAPAGPGGGAG